jgi:hypothetical protein
VVAALIEVQRQALRDAIVDAAGLEQGVDQPQADADDHHEEDEQHKIAAAASASPLFPFPLIHAVTRINPGGEDKLNRHETQAAQGAHLQCKGFNA